MNVTKPLREARDALKLPADCDARAIKAAYRRALAEHPPDADEAGFRAVRSAYEMLRDPHQVAKDTLFSPYPVSPPPAPPTPSAPLPAGTTAKMLLRLLAGELDVALLFGSSPSADTSAKPSGGKDGLP